MQNRNSTFAASERDFQKLNGALILFAVLALAFAVQTAHFAEHVAQVFQIYALGIKPPMAHGLLGSVFDFEWVHFLYNIALWVVLFRLWFGYRAQARTNPSRELKLGLAVLTGSVLFQGYHSVEHVVKLYQFLYIALYQSGAVPTPGIVPTATGVPIFVLHFWLNAIVWGTMLVALWLVRPKRVSAPSRSLNANAM